ncbi:AAA family ATPase [Candidatus Woesearchaeota archaeon]|nr:AAA family ATPase [Candidatus Woesearchaeota archaeon]
MQTKLFLITGNAGQGKSAVARNIAKALATFGYEVLLVDGDTKTPKQGHYFGIPLAQHTIQDVLLERKSLAQATYQTPSRIKLIPSNIAEIETPHPAKLLPHLKELAQIILVDVPTNDFTWYSTGAETILITQPDFPSVLEAHKLCKKAHVTNIIVNRTHAEEKELTNQNITELTHKNVLGRIPEDKLLRSALRSGYSVIETQPESETSLAIRQIAANLLNLDYQPSLKKENMLERLGIFP